MEPVTLCVCLYVCGQSVVVYVCVSVCLCVCVCVCDDRYRLGRGVPRYGHPLWAKAVATQPALRPRPGGPRPRSQLWGKGGGECAAVRSIPYGPIPAAVMGPFSSSPFLAQRPSPFRHTVRTLGPFDRTMCRDTCTCAVHFVCTVHSLFAHRPSPFWHTVGTLGPFDVNMWIRAVERHCLSLGNMWIPLD